MSQRIYTGAGPAPKRTEGWNSDELHVHVRGRAENSVKMLIICAYMRSERLLPAGGLVTVAGAKWQDWKGTKTQPRAHRFPCNPQIGGRFLPDFAKSKGLRSAIEEVLSETDFLPVDVNYADILFEKNGGIESARRGIEQVISRQKEGKPVDHSAIDHVWRQTIYPGYLLAWHAVEDELLGKNVHENPEKYLERLGQYKDTRPATKYETALEVAYDARRSTEMVSQPSILSTAGSNWYLKKLTS